MGGRQRVIQSICTIWVLTVETARAWGAAAEGVRFVGNSGGHNGHATCRVHPRFYHNRSSNGSTFTPTLGQFWCWKKLKNFPIKIVNIRYSITICHFLLVKLFVILFTLYLMLLWIHCKVKFVLYLGKMKRSNSVSNLVNWILVLTSTFDIIHWFLIIYCL